MSSSNLVASIQLLLRGLGYDPENADGQMTADTSTAIREFQADHHVRVDGQVSGQLLVSLSSAAARGLTNRS